MLYRPDKWRSISNNDEDESPVLTQIDQSFFFRIQINDKLFWSPFTRYWLERMMFFPFWEFFLPQRGKIHTRREKKSLRGLHLIYANMPIAIAPLPIIRDKFIYSSSFYFEMCSNRKRETTLKRIKMDLFPHDKQTFQVFRCTLEKCLKEVLLLMNDFTSRGFHFSVEVFVHLR